jgi:hypothetical protein
MHLECHIRHLASKEVARFTWMIGRSIHVRSEDIMAWFDPVFSEVDALLSLEVADRLVIEVADTVRVELLDDLIQEFCEGLDDRVVLYYIEGHLP